MKTCQLCQNSYDDDFLFCLVDGSKLDDSGGEQETLVSPRIQMVLPSEFPANDSTFCEACGQENNPGSTFCKQCGTAVATVFPVTQINPHQPVGAFNFDQTVNHEPFHVAPPPPPPPGQTITFNPQPPAPAGYGNPPADSNRNVVIGIFAGVAVLAVIAFLLVNSSVKPTERVQAPTTKATATSEPYEKLPKYFEKRYEGTIGGQGFSMQLTRSGSDLTGTASTRKTDYVYGTIDNDGSFRLEGRENDQQITGNYKGRIHDDGSISGTWTTPRGGKSTSFSLSEQ